MSDVPLRSTTFPTPKTHNTTCACCCTRKEIKYYEEKYEEKQNMKRLCNNDTSSRRDILFLRPDMGQGKLLLFHFFVFLFFFVFCFGQVTRQELMGTCAWQSRVKKTTNRDKKKKKRLFSFPFYFWRIACEFSFWWKNRNENTFDNVLTEGAILSTRTARKYISIYNVVYVIVVMYCTWNVHKNPSVQVVTPSFKLTDNKTKVTLLLATT